MAASIRTTRFCVLSRKIGFGTPLLNEFAISKRYVEPLKVNHKLELDSTVKQWLSNEEITHKKHPGLVNIKQVQLPQKLLDAIDVLVEKYPTPNLQQRAKEMATTLWKRNTPMEHGQLQQQIHQIEQNVLARNKINMDSMTSSQIDKTLPKLKKKAMHLWFRTVHPWKPIEYDAYNSFLYLVGKLANDYAALLRIFSEMQKRDPTFRPWHVFDMGSGVGSLIWAANTTWKNVIREHYCVDVSEDMNTVSRLLLQGGHDHQDMCFPGVYYRQFMPTSVEHKYDLVVCSYTLCELPNQEERLKVILSLWRKTHKYLVLVESGTNAGFRLISEARDLVLQLGEESFRSKAHQVQEDLRGHVFAPCPHDSPCPKALRHDGEPCCFTADYKPFTISGKKEQRGTARFCFVVLQKGVRSETEAAWPRVVKPVSHPSKRSHFRTCTPGGELELAIVTASKHGKDLYRCTRKCQWGDLLPVTSPTWEGGPQTTYANLGQPAQTNQQEPTSDEANESQMKQVVMPHRHRGQKSPLAFVGSDPIDPFGPKFYSRLEMEQAERKQSDSSVAVDPEQGQRTTMAYEKEEGSILQATEQEKGFLSTAEEGKMPASAAKSEESSISAAREGRGSVSVAEEIDSSVLGSE